MAIQTTININVDFHDKKYVLINAKQYDKNSRFISVSCYNNGDQFRVNISEHSAFVRYRKSDEYGVFNFCNITDDGKVLVELTEQMLSSEGICYADLVIVNRGSAKVDANTGEIVAINNTAILSTMTFCIDVSGMVVDNLEIESSYEFDALNVLLEKANAEYKQVIQTAKSYTHGNAGGIRLNEDTDNAKYYYEQSLSNSNNAGLSETNAKKSEDNAKESENKAATSERNAKVYRDNAKTYQDKAEEYMNNAKASASNASSSETNAKTYMDAAENSKNDSLDYSVVSKRYAVGGTNTVENEDIDNSKYYYEHVKSINNSISGQLNPKGTISFNELNTIDKLAGDMYIIEDNFITDDTFASGSGIEYPAGTIVYYTVNDCWDCFVGFAVTGIKGNEENSYRVGNVNITPENIGIYIASVDEVKGYLGI